MDGEQHRGPSEEEGLLLDLYEHAPFGYLSTSSDWTILRVNTTFADLVGVPPEQLVGRHFRELLAAGSRIFHETHHAPLVNLQGIAREISSDLSAADGASVPVLMTSVRRSGDDDSGAVVRTAVVPAHQRRKFEAEVQRMRRRAEESERRTAVLHRVVAALAATVEVADVAVAVDTALGTDAAATTGVWVPTDADTLGRLTPNGKIGGATLEITSSSYIARAWRSGRPVVDRGLAGIPMADAPEPSGVVAIALDRVMREPDPDDTVDPTNELGPEHHDLLVTIGQEVGQALRRARLFEHRAWLLGIAAHDLRTPLTTVLGCAETLHDKPEGTLGDRDRMLLQQMVSAGRGMATLIEDVLEMAEIEGGGISLERHPADLAELVHRAVDGLATQARDKEITVTVHTSDEVRPVTLDVHRVRRVVDNLVSNAIKYSPAGAHVEVRVLDHGESVSVEVEDHGVGIPEDELGHVFQPFRRSTSQPTAGERSTGLGLSIARHLAEAHDGRIEVASQLGEGSTFRLRLPRRQA